MNDAAPKGKIDIPLTLSVDKVRDSVSILRRMKGIVYLCYTVHVANSSFVLAIGRVQLGSGDD